MNDETKTPPAQAAKVDCPTCGGVDLSDLGVECVRCTSAPTAEPAAQVDAMPEIRAWLADYADELDEQGFTDVAATIRTTAASIGASPTAEPDAKGEAVAGAPSTEAAEAMGAKGGPAVEAERLAFEAWMKGHCWTLGATWRDGAYRSDAEQGGKLCPHAMQTRGLWAAWRDRAALAAQPRAVPDEAVASFVESVAVIIQGHTFPSGKALYKARGISDLALRMLAAAPPPGESE